MVNVGLICGDDRNRLTEQCIRSFYENTDLSVCNLTVLANNVEGPTWKLLTTAAKENGLGLVNSDVSLGGGRVTNVLLREARTKDAKFLYHSASDFYFRPGWLEALLANWPICEAMGVGLLGGYSHPYHLPHGLAVKGTGGYSVQPRQAVGAGSWMMKWETWDKFGPLNELHKGVWIGSEDTEFCFKLIAANVGMATLVPEVTIHTGRTASNGQPTLGAEMMPDISGVLIE